MSDATRGQVSGSAAEIYDAFFLPALFAQWPEHVLDAAGVGSGDHVLDTGTGTGVLARAASQRVGAEGEVIGLDPNGGMLEVARRSAAPVTWVEGTAEALPFESARFNRVVSQFALMFFTDRGQAVHEMVRVARPGGTVAIAVWASLDATPGYAGMVELLDRQFGREAGDALRAPYAFGDASMMEDLLADWFTDVRVEQRDGVARFESIDDWVRTDIRGWTLAGSIDDEQLAELQQEARTALADFVDSDGRVTFQAPALIATARRA